MTEGNDSSQKTVARDETNVGVSDAFAADGSTPERGGRGFGRGSVALAVAAIAIAAAYCVTTAAGAFVSSASAFASVEEAFLISVLVFSRALCHNKIHNCASEALVAIDVAAFADKSTITRMLGEQVNWFATTCFVVRFLVRMLCFSAWGLLLAETVFEAVCAAAATVSLVAWYAANYLRLNGRGQKLLDIF